MSIGKRIGELRAKAGYDSLGQLHKASGVTVATLSRIENDIQKPTPNTLKKLAPHLKVTYEELMGIAGYITVKPLLSDIQIAMNKRNYTIEQLAEKTGIELTHMRGIVSGDIKPSANELNRISGELNLDYKESGFPPQHIDILESIEDQNTTITAGSTPLTREQRIAVLKALISPEGNKAIQKPILGNIVAGIPLLSEQNIIDYIEVTPEMDAIVDFGLIVHGDSMIGAGIHSGDIVLCKQTQVGKHGQIVVALVNDDETTLKYFIHENKKDLLRAANPDYKDIELHSDDRIQGYVVQILKAPPSLNSYKDFIYYKEKHFEDWNEIIEMAVTNGIDPLVIKGNLQMQIALAHKIAGK